MNIIFIMSDTFRFDHQGHTGLGKCETPNIDKLAASAHVFQNAYISSYPTVPNRWDIFTGRLNHTYAQWQPLPAGEVVVSQVLSEGGYTTMMVADTPHILQRGFGYQRGFDAFEWTRGQENDHWQTYPKEPELPCAPEKLRSPDYTMVHYMRNRDWWQSEDDCFVSRTMATAAEWIEKNHDQGEFFLYVDTFDPHEPWDAPASYNAKYVDPAFTGEKVIYPQYHPASYFTEDEIKYMQAIFAAESELVDAQVGKVLATVERLGLADNTAIVFTSDHGFCHGEHGIVGKSIIAMDAKRQYFESVPFYHEIAHIPLVVRLPGQTERQDHQCLVQSIDMMPTILELAEVIETEVVEGKSKVQTIQCGFHQEVAWSVDLGKLHGHSLVPVMNGEIDELRDVVVSSATLMMQTPRVAKAAVRTRDWALMYCGKKVSDEHELPTPALPPNRHETDYVVGRHNAMLFDLKNDPGELHDVIEDNLDVARDLHRRYVEFLTTSGTAPQVMAKHRDFVLSPDGS